MDDSERLKHIENRDAQTERICGEMGEMINGIGLSLLQQGQFLPELMSVILRDKKTGQLFVAFSRVDYLRNKTIRTIVKDLAFFASRTEAVRLVDSFLKRNPEIPIVCDLDTTLEALRDSQSRIMVRMSHCSILKRPGGAIAVYY